MIGTKLNCHRKQIHIRRTDNLFYTKVFRIFIILIELMKLSFKEDTRVTCIKTMYG